MLGGGKNFIFIHLTQPRRFTHGCSERYARCTMYQRETFCTADICTHTGLLCVSELIVGAATEREAVRPLEENRVLREKSTSTVLCADKTCELFKKAFALFLGLLCQRPTNFVPTETSAQKRARKMRYCIAYFPLDTYFRPLGVVGQI